MKRKDGATGKGKEKDSSSSMDVQHFFKDHTQRNWKGLRALITSSGPYYLDLVRMFYCNMCIENGKFVTHVRGKRIALTPKKLGQILDIPSGGSMLYDPEDEEWKEYNKREFYFGLSRISKEEYHEKMVESHGGEEPPKDF
ncbi:hypothetical protein KIW84_020290 [Lathyrus oleraceus]|uniref:Uncharacterized protein n=1 Tax=Pisum sativum TaxID=3888 RepID=A0A9D4YA71_PEA|nr:hypothetical protein KIW84_020290 [Pisum sativum]